MKINFSFVIPHKNSPDLLSRCVKSIPNREDVEIIIVDDNSDEEKKPVFAQKNINTIYLDACHSNGAGHARNIGIEKVRGTWVLFADADDSYSESLLPTLDYIIKLDTDVVFFNYNVINKEGNIYSSHYNESEAFQIKYGLTAPWNKAVRYGFIKEHDIRFEECPVGNDIMYSYQVAYLAHDRFKIVDAPLYNYYINSNSITHKKKHNELYYLTICKHIYQQNSFFSFLGYNKHSRSMLSKLMAILIKKGWSQFILTLKVYVANKKEIHRDRNYYVDVVRHRDVNTEITPM